MAAMYRSDIGKDSCSCTFLLLDIDLAKEWLGSFKKFLDEAVASLKSIKANTLFKPWTLSTLEEHKLCFRQWCILQFLVGVAMALMVFLLSVMFYNTESYVQNSYGSMIVNALLRCTVLFFVTWILWFGVIAKHGCCCAVFFCCLGKPILLVISIVEVLFALSTVMAIIQAFDHGHSLLIIAALASCMHLVTQVYLTVEIFVIWAKTAKDVSSGVVDGAAGSAPVILGQSASKEAKGTTSAVAEEGKIESNIEGCTVTSV